MWEMHKMPAELKCVEHVALAEGICSTYAHSFILRGLNTEGVKCKCGINNGINAFARDGLGFGGFF